MSSKFSLVPVLTGQLSTLVDSRTGKPRAEDYFVLFVLPLILGFCSWLWWDWRLPGVSELIAGASIMTSLLFGLAIFVFGLRLQLSADTSGVATRDTTVLVEEMFKNACWAVVVGLLLTLLTIVAGVSRDVNGAGLALPVGEFQTGLLLTISAHFIGVIAMSLKRLNAAFNKLHR